MGHDFLSVYAAKLLEYGLAIGYLLLFIPFWWYVQGGKKAEKGAAAAKHAKPARGAATWFQVPAGIHLHPGHTWARVEADGLVAIGADDFAHKLVGVAKVELPALGAKVAQGEPAFGIGDGDKDVPMLSPVDGTVVAVNQALKDRKDGLDDPYGRAWLFKVKANRLAANLRQLLTAGPAQRLMEDTEESIALRIAPELGHVLQDGGTPVHGIARALAGDDWDALARQYFLT
jgi:glycine cleavage system H lipoate-binding protein